MVVEDKAAEGLPTWLEQDNDEDIPPAALRPIYGKLPQSVTKACERARKTMRDGFKRGVMEVHEALAKHGLFKEWCVAAGVNYRTAQSIVARHEEAERRKQEKEHEQEQEDEPASEPEPEPGETSDTKQAGGTASPSRSPASDDGEPPDDEVPDDEPLPDPTPNPKDKAKDKPAPEPEPNNPKPIILRPESDEQRAEVIARLRAVGEAEQVATDLWMQIVVRLLDVYEKQQSGRQATGEAA